MTARPPLLPNPDAVGWQQSAACRSHDPEAWYPHDKSGTGDFDPWAFARSVCSRCSVAAECLDAALAEESPYGKRYGMRAGMTPQQRQRIAARRAAERRASA